ncbi:MAG: hypothetical protein MJZ26_04740 [Fibrobacter sp.]|nr:hypothetical protein [Fibrobacter sp.]
MSLNSTIVPEIYLPSPSAGLDVLTISICSGILTEYVSIVPADTLASPSGITKVYKPSSALVNATLPPFIRSDDASTATLIFKETVSPANAYLVLAATSVLISSEITTL